MRKERKKIPKFQKPEFLIFICYSQESKSVLKQNQTLKKFELLLTSIAILARLDWQRGNPHFRILSCQSQQTKTK